MLVPWHSMSCLLSTPQTPGTGGGESDGGQEGCLSLFPHVFGLLLLHDQESFEGGTFTHFSFGEAQIPAHCLRVEFVTVGTPQLEQGDWVARPSQPWLVLGEDPGVSASRRSRTELRRRRRGGDFCSHVGDSRALEPRSELLAAHGCWRASDGEQVEDAALTDGRELFV